jgi:tetratricopeptide (TPR) repeat protein
VEWDLSVLGETLKRHLSLRLSPAPRRNAVSSILKDWNNGIHLAERFAFLQKLSLEIEEFDWSIEACDKGVQYSSGIHTKEWFYSEAANCLRIVGRFPEALRQIDLAIKNYSPPSDLATLAAAYNVRGLILHDQRRPKATEALRAFRKALDLLHEYELTAEAAEWKNELLVFHARIENNIGLAYDSLRKSRSAIEHFKTSLLYKRKAGDLIGRAQTCVNLACLFYRYEKDSRYQYWRSAAIKLITKYGLRYQEAELLRETGRIDCEQQRVSMALVKLRNALRIYQEINAAKNDLKITRRIIRRCSTGKPL